MMANGFGILAACGLLAAGIFASGQAPKKIDFNRDIRPILSKCMTCHGPDSGEGAAGLRLDSFAAATKKLASGEAAIVPGKPNESELIRRVRSEGDDIMPPQSSHKMLSGEEMDLLEEWVRQGAEYKEHWAFVTPTRPQIPEVRDANWVVNPIDAFVLAKLEEVGMKPEQEADRPTLLRRVSLDITGLPPTIEEVQAFVQDKSPNAYEKVVDRLLASPRYGERMAMDWMDYARYADSNGYQADYERFQSRWRDWVIDAFNDNMPYDQFVVEQIAGDLLPNATMEQKLATAFNRNHRINTEGGVIAEEWRVEVVVDRVETTSAVFLGLTAGCARCHDHKYDPFSQKDFYKFYAYFNNVPETGSGEERPISHPPTMKAPTPEQTRRLAEIANEVSKLDAAMSQAIRTAMSKAANWKLEMPLPRVGAGLVSRIAFDGGSKGYKLEGKAALELGRATGAVRTGPEAFADLGEIGDFERDRGFSYGAWIWPDNGNGSPFSRMDANNAFRGWEASLVGGRVQAHLINKWPENGMKIATKTPIPNGKWTHVLVTYDGSSKVAGLKMYLNGKFVETNVENDSLKDTIRTTVSTKVGRRTPTEAFAGMVDDFVLYDRELKPEEVAKLASTHPATRLLTIPVQKRDENLQKSIARLWLLDHSEEFQRLDADYQKATNTQAEIDGQIPSVMVMQEMEKPRETFVLDRGVYDKPKDKVEPGLPGFLPPPPPNAPKNRLGLAQWIVSPDNPLTARVTVNRLWERFFGNGIVQTLEDFGTRAEFPTHPELLDYLATELHRLDWDLKAVIKQIVMSNAYRQSSAISPEKLEKDPQNRLVSRGPRFRLPGEVIRDQALFVSGLLHEKLGGPSVYPYMPEGVWDETNFYGNLRNYKHTNGPDLYRRSLYTIWKRTAAPPNMLVFDVPSREACRVQRARTDTPLQALTLMNDVTYLEAARVLAQKMMREGGKSPEERLDNGFQRVLARKPTKEELNILKTGWVKKRATYQNDLRAARELRAIGEAPIDMGLDLAELAAYTVAASTLLNLDEVVNKE